MSVPAVEAELAKMRQRIEEQRNSLHAALTRASKLEAYLEVAREFESAAPRPAFPRGAMSLPLPPMVTDNTPRTSTPPLVGKAG